MEQVLTFLSANPLYLVVAAVILAVLVFGAIKKIIQLVILAALVLAGYLAYVTYVSADTRQSVEQSLETGATKVLKAGEKVGEKAGIPVAK